MGKSVTKCDRRNDEATQKRLMARYEEGITYSRRIGNLYTGSFIWDWISLLENSQALKSGARIGLFSYGSGAGVNFFTGYLEEGYQNFLSKKTIKRC